MAKVIEYTKFVEEIPQPPVEKIYDLDDALGKVAFYQGQLAFWADIVDRAKKAGARSKSELTQKELEEIAPSETL